MMARMPYPPVLQDDAFAPEHSHQARVDSPHTGSIDSSQLGSPPQDAQAAQLGLPQQPLGLRCEIPEQQIISALRQLLPLSESEAVAMTPAFETALNVRASCPSPSAPAWCCDHMHH